MAVQTAKAGKLQQLAKSMPQVNEKVAQQARETNLARIQDMVRQAPQGTGGIQAAQQMGAQQAQAAGQASVEAAGQTANQLGQVGQLGVQETAREQRAKSFDQSLNLRKGQLDFANKLDRLDSQYKNQLLDQNLEFQKDEAGRTLFNQRQLADFKALTARNEEELRNYQQQVQQFTERKLKMYNVALQKINQKLQQERQSTDAKLDREQREQLMRAKKAMEDKVREEQRKASRKMAIASGVGMAVGAVGGAFVGGPAGAAAGAQLGAGLGTTVASQT